MKFFTTYGIEFSYVLSDLFYEYEKKSDIVESYADIVEAFLNQWKKTNKIKCSLFECHDDCGVVEVDSPIFHNWKEVKAFYAAMDDIAKQLNLSTHRESTGSGGGHIHTGIPKEFLRDEDKLALYLVNILRDMSNRPYLNALFNDYPDNHTSNHLSRKSQLIKLLKPTLKIGDIAEMMSTYCSGYYYISYNQQSKIFRYLYYDEGYVRPNSDYKTIEFRIFDMPKSLDRVKKHLMFVDRYLRYIYKLTIDKQLVETQYSNRKQWTNYCNSFENVGKTKQEFKELLKILKLDYNDYKYLIKENFLNRLEAGYNIN